MSTDRQTRKWLHDAIAAAEEVLEHTSDVDFPTFAADRMRQRATYFPLAILGEALSHLPALRAEMPEAGLAIAMRNRLIHEYFSIDVGIVWTTAKQDVPNMRDRLREMLDSQ